MKKPLLTLTTVRTRYGTIEALHGVTLTVNQGEIVTVIGANGAGKTTTLLSIAGIQQIYAGQIQFAEHIISGIPAHEIVRLGLALVPEGRQIFPRLTVLENLELGAYTRTDKTEIKNDLQQTFDLFPVLYERRSQLGGTLSGGEQQMLAIGRALMSHPRMLLMDEPSMGVAPLIIQKIFETITTLNKRGMTILLVEQNANLALKTSTRGYLLENGKTVVDGDSQTLLDHPRVREAYLGG